MSVVRWARTPLVPLVAAVVALSAAFGLLSGVSPKLGIVGALGIVFVALVFVDLLVGFASMVLLAYLDMLTELGGVSLAKVAGALLVVAWLAVMSTRAGATRNFFKDRPGLTYLLVAFLGWNTISIAWSQSHGDATSSVVRYTLNAVLIPIAYTAVRDRRDIVRVLGTIVFGATLAAISGIVVPPDPAAADAGRAAGTIGDPNELAAALVVGGAVAGAFAVNRHVATPLRALSGVSAGLCFVSILLSLSRGGLLGVIGVLVAAVVFGGRWRPRVAGVCGALALVGVCYFAFVASLPAKERVLNVGGGTGRIDLWTVGARMVEAHPFRGVGSGQFQDVSVHYLLKPGAIQRGDFILSKPKVAHNTYLNVTAELGLVGAALFLAVALISFGCLLLAVRQLRREGDERLEILLRGVLVGICGYLVTLMFISEDYSKLLWFLLSLGPALLVAVRGTRPAALPPPPSTGLAARRTPAGALP
jgi:O-antigen ligase